MSAVPPAFPGTEKRSIRTWLFNPFHYLAGGSALACGLGAIALGALFGWLSKSHFDGVLDFHAGVQGPWWSYWVEGPINWLLLSVLLFAGAKLISKSRVRALDVFGTQALARVPAMVMPLTQLPPPVQRITDRIVAYATNPAAMTGANATSPLANIPIWDLAWYAVAILIMLAMIVWMVQLMYRAFAVSANVSGGKAIGTFVVLLVIAEILSKIVFYVLFTLAG